MDIALSSGGFYLFAVMGSLSWGIEGHAPPDVHAAAAVTSERSGIPRPRRFFVPAEGISTHPRIQKRIRVRRPRVANPTHALSCCYEYARMLRLDDDGRWILLMIRIPRLR
jgi:hypothetical protein